MKKYLRIVLAILLTAASAESHAQLNSGYVFGMHLSTMTVRAGGVNYSAKTPLGFHFGMFYELPVASHFSFQTGFLFSAKGSDYKTDTSDITISPIYVELPANLLCTFGSRAVKVSLLAGPYIAGGAGGYEIVGGDPLKNISFGKGEKCDLKRFDLGYSLGARVDIKGFLISLNYEEGLKNISPVASADNKLRNKVVGITISMQTRGHSTTFGRRYTESQ